MSPRLQRFRVVYRDTCVYALEVMATSATHAEEIVEAEYECSSYETFTAFDGHVDIVVEQDGKDRQ